MRIEELSVEELAELLRDAERAHGAYERELGARDDDWPSWYAQYMLDRLRESA
jgi:hypothetical protein